MLRSRQDAYYDWITIGIYLSLLIIGWLAIYSVTYSFNVEVDYLDLNVPITKQTLYLLFALIVFFSAQFINDKFWHTFAYLIYGLSVFLLVLVLMIGTEIKGAKAWFVFGGFSIQPSEIAKIGTALALSSFLSYYKTNLKIRNYQLISAGIILLPMFLIQLQPDSGSALTFLSFFLLLFIEGLNPLYFIFGILLTIVFICAFLFDLSFILLGILILGLVISFFFFKKFKYQALILPGILCALIFANFFFEQNQVLLASGLIFILSLIYLWKSKEERMVTFLVFGFSFLSLFAYSSVSFFNKLEPHQQERIKVWLKPSECDPRGALYNVLQSKVAIGSGGFSGKGFLQGNMTKLKFVPEQSTDFIFSSIGEEHGFIGSSIVIVLFFVLIYRILRISESAEKKFLKSFALCVAGLILFHVLINIGMTLGLLPIIGIPLPFISKGGSALIGFSLMLGILMRMQSRNK